MFQKIIFDKIEIWNIQTFDCANENNVLKNWEIFQTKQNKININKEFTSNQIETNGYYI